MQCNTDVRKFRDTRVSLISGDKLLLQICMAAAIIVMRRVFYVIWHG